MLLLDRSNYLELPSYLMSNSFAQYLASVLLKSCYSQSVTPAASAMWSLGRPNPENGRSLIVVNMNVSPIWGRLFRISMICPDNGIVWRSLFLVIEPGGSKLLYQNLHSLGAFLRLLSGVSQLTAIPWTNLQKGRPFFSSLPIVDLYPPQLKRGHGFLTCGVSRSLWLERIAQCHVWLPNRKIHL
jgi:hypothetical protein